MVATARPASGRSPTPAAARSARPTTAAATAASARWRRRTPPSLARSGAAAGRADATSCAPSAPSTPNAPAFREESERHELPLIPPPPPPRRRHPTIKVDYLARVEGEGALTSVEDGVVDRREARSSSRRASSRPSCAGALRRGARHHRAHLRHLPGRLPDERLPRDGGRARASGDRGRCARCAGCSTAASGSRATAARLHAARARFPRLRDAHRPPRWRRTTHRQRARSSKRGLRSRSRQRHRRAARRPRDPPDQRARRRLLRSVTNPTPTPSIPCSRIAAIISSDRSRASP
jgi:hypothetical protein